MLKLENSNLACGLDTNGHNEQMKN